jgi:hypothetical protein
MATHSDHCMHVVNTAATQLSCIPHRHRRQTACRRFMFMCYGSERPLLLSFSVPSHHSHAPLFPSYSLLSPHSPLWDEERWCVHVRRHGVLPYRERGGGRRREYGGRIIGRAETIWWWSLCIHTTRNTGVYGVTL